MSVTKETPPKKRKAPGKTVTKDATSKVKTAAGVPSTRELESSQAVYDTRSIEDAPEFHDLARSMGILATGTRTQGVRPVADRIADFCFAYPPTRPVVNSGGRLRRQQDGTFAPGESQDRLARFETNTWEPGTLHELLSRYGLKMRDAPQRVERDLKLDPLREVAKRRNVRLRVLHGGVDVEPANMDAAKAEYLDRQEKQQAAKDIRAARARMQAELTSTK